MKSCLDFFFKKKKTKQTNNNNNKIKTKQKHLKQVYTSVLGHIQNNSVWAGVHAWEMILEVIVWVSVWESSEWDLGVGAVKNTSQAALTLVLVK